MQRQRQNKVEIKPKQDKRSKNQLPSYTDSLNERKNTYENSGKPVVICTKIKRSKQVKQEVQILSRKLIWVIYLI